MWSPLVTTGQVKTGDFIFCSTGGNTVEEAGILWNWISVKSPFFLNFYSRFTSPSPHPALQRPLVFIKALKAVCQQGSPPSSTLTPPAPQSENQDDIAPLALRACELLQRSPTVPGTGFVEDSFSTDCGQPGDGLGMIQVFYIYCALYFHYYYISSTSDHQAYNPRGCRCMLSHVSRVRLFATPWTAARQAPLSVGFSRHECWSG